MGNLNNRNRRRTYIVRMDFQKDFIIRFCALIIAAGVIVSGIVYFFCGTTVTTVFRESRLKIISTADFIGPYLALSSLIAVIVAGLACWWMTLIVSNRLAGPLFRLETDIAKLAQGDLTQQFRLRNKDEFQGLARIINDMAKDLHGDVSSLKQQVIEIERIGHLSPEAKRSLEQMKNIIGKYKV